MTNFKYNPETARFENGSESLTREEFHQRTRERMATHLATVKTSSRKVYRAEARERGNVNGYGHSRSGKRAA